jgi:hypothetical protein
VLRSRARLLGSWIVAGVVVAAASCAGAAPIGRSLPAAGSPASRSLQKADAADGETGPTTSLAPPAPALFVRCEDRASCPSGVGMLVVEAGAAAAPERCTAALIGPDRVITASHCLAPDQRHAGAPCSRTWVSFPETADAPAEWATCAHIVFASDVPGQDALRQEYAVLRLQRSIGRAPLAIDPAPPEANSIVTVVSVTPHPVYGSTHALSSRLCRAVDAERATRALGPAAAKVGWLASCPIAPGNSGSPVLDYHGRIRAIVHGGTSLSTAFAVTSGLSP